jgi:hypothetical protein
VNSHTKGSKSSQSEKIAANSIIERAEILISKLREQEPVEFILRSLYGKDDTSNITKVILDTINLNTDPEEIELLISLLSTASHIPHDIEAINDNNIYEILIELQKLKIKQNLDPKKRTISVYFPDSAYRGQVGDILNKLKERNFNTITFIGTIYKDKYEEMDNVYYGGHGIISQMNFVDLFICATYAQDLPANSKKVYFMHDIHDSPVSKEKDILKLILEYDYHFAPSSSVLERVKKQIYQARSEGYLKKQKLIGLIPGGYIKLDQNLELFKKHRKEEKILIHAPTVMDTDIEDLACLPRHSELIIDALLQNFPDYKIIFRPHPHTAKTTPALRIAEKHKNNPRFTFDDDGSFYMNNYAKSALMITDFSGTAFTYALTTLRPVVFFSHNENAFQNKFNNFKYTDDRNKIGVVAQSIDELTNSVRSLLKDKNKYEPRIKCFRDSLIYNVSNAEDYFISNIDHILNGTRNNDWTYLEIDPLPPKLIEEGYKGFNIVKFQSKFIALSQELGNISLNKLVSCKTNLNSKYFIASSKTEAIGYIDGITLSAKLIETLRRSKPEIIKLEKIISKHAARDKQLINELKEKADLLEQLINEIDRMEDHEKSLSRKIEISQQEIANLRNELADKNIRIDTLTNEITAKSNRPASRTNVVEGKISKVSSFDSNRENQAGVWSGNADTKKIKLETLAKELGRKKSKEELFTQELEFRDKWIHLLRDKLKATASQNNHYRQELKKVQSSFLHRFIK